MNELHEPVVHDILNANIYFNWGWQGIGFGQLWVGKSQEDDRLVIDAECMSKESTRKLLYALVDKLLEEAELQ